MMKAAGAVPLRARPPAENPRWGWRWPGCLHGEIVCMDSMQIYRGMDIGTAKPTKAEQADIPHHLLDIVEPDEPYTVAQYAEDAKRVCKAIAGRGRLPILVGGTGFYLRALTHGLTLGGVRSDPAVRERLKVIAQDEEGKRRLHAMLTAVDPVSAARLHPNDIPRVSRALEVYELTGEPMSAQEQPEADSPFAFCMLGAELERTALYNRINARVDTMMVDGLLEEVKALLAGGVSPKAQAMQGIGYKELVPVLMERAPLPGAVAEIKRNSRHYAKRQFTWFRREERIHWLDMAGADPRAEALAIVRTFLEG